MDEVISSNKLISEEKKAAKLFLWLFYIIFYSYDYFYYFVFLSSTDKGAGIPKGGLGYWFYGVILALLPINMYLTKKKNNPYISKYFYFITYNLLDLLNNIIIYFGTDKPFRSGNIIEVFFILFAPLFINKKYFWVVSVGMIAKYAILGIALSSVDVFITIAFLAVFSLISFIFLGRFSSYVRSIKSIYEEMRQTEKLAVIGQMAAAVGHEIRNPLASLKGFTQLQYERYPNTNDFYPIMIQEIDRINWIVNDLMYLGKPKSVHFERANISEIISYTLSITEHQAKAQNIKINSVTDMPLPTIECECDEKQLKQVFLNLLKNAMEAMPTGGVIDIKVSNFDINKVKISIQDDGCGIPDEHIENLGAPFYSTKKDGTGLGLMVTNQIIKDHKGEIKINSSLGHGTTVEVILPISQK